MNRKPRPDRHVIVDGTSGVSAGDTTINSTLTTIAETSNTSTSALTVSRQIDEYAIVAAHGLDRRGAIGRGSTR